MHIKLTKKLIVFHHKLILNGIYTAEQLAEIMSEAVMMEISKGTTGRREGNTVFDLIVGHDFELPFNSEYMVELPFK